jgi:hypothetical protein
LQIAILKSNSNSNSSSSAKLIGNLDPLNKNILAPNQFDAFGNVPERNLNFSMEKDQLKHDVIAQGRYMDKK